MTTTIEQGAPFLRLAEDDNIAVAVRVIEPGTALGGAMTAGERIPFGHKMALVPIAAGEPVRKFGQVIGFARTAIAPGNWVHEHNLAMAEFERDYRFCTEARPVNVLPTAEQATFEGFRRATGRIGTRNYIGILTSVNCSATVARFIAEEARARGLLDQYPQIDGVVAFTHGTGCGMAADGEGFEMLRRTQWGYAAHPNLGGVLMVGLGCEVFQIARLKQLYGLEESETFRTMTIQETGGTRRTVEAGLATLREMLPAVGAHRRETVPAGEITLALQCGGSDGYSGITANPALGVAADMLVRNGGTAVLAETPEIYGAEHLLTARARDRAVGEKLVERIRWWEDYVARNRGEMNNNPSPGNKAGGLTTILEKSLGAAAKGGSTPLNGVYEYAEPVREKGFVFMDTPGYDPVSVTGQVAGGCNVVCFTTGRGSAYGCKPVPSIKLATNPAVYERMREDMDVNCGDILEGASLEDKGRQIFERVLEVASGRRTASETLGYGDSEFVPWQVGATM